jgi:glycosyltransferase involved in cell wall biosynthesis
MRLNSADGPLVAIATPVYNGEAFLAETMACVQAQTYGNLVHIVVDNASTDATSEIIARFMKGRVPVFLTRNQETLPVAKNWTLAAACVPREAKYFQILCADDLLHHTAVEKMVALAESDPSVELVGCAYYRGDHLHPVGLPRGQNVFDGAAIASAFLSKRSNDVPHSHGLFRRHDVDFEQDFYEFPHASYDTDACLRALSRGKFGFVHEPLYTFRIHAGQLSNMILGKNRSSVLDSLLEIKRWAPKVMRQEEAEACLRLHLRVVYRYMLAWRALGRRDLYERHRRELKDLGVRPNLFDYLQCVIEWPVIELLDRWARISQRRTWQATEHQDDAA